MTENGVRCSYNDLVLYEAAVQAELDKAELALGVANAYKAGIADPGWPEASEMYGYAAMGVALLATFTPVGAIGILAYGTGLYLTAYGTVGAGLYASQALSRTFPWLPGAAANSGAGETYRRLMPHFPDKKEKSPTEIVTGEVLGDRVEKLFERASRPAAGTPGLPSADMVDPFTKELENKTKELENKIKELENKIKELEKMMDEMEKRKESQPTIKPAAPPRLTIKPKENGPKNAAPDPADLLGGGWQTGEGGRTQAGDDPAKFSDVA